MLAGRVWAAAAVGLTLSHLMRSPPPLQPLQQPLRLMQPLLDAAVDDRAAAAEHERDAGVGNGSYSSELSSPSELSSVASPASEA